MLKFISYVPTLHSSEVLVLIALIYVLVFYKTYSACRIMFKRVIWKPFPCETEGREWRKQSVVKKLGKRKTKLQNRARSFSIRIRDSAFPSNRTDGMRNIFEKRNVSFNTLMWCLLDDVRSLFFFYISRSSACVVL